VSPGGRDGGGAVAIVLGAARFPRSQALDAAELADAFAASKRDVLGILSSFAEVLDRFDSPQSPNALCEEIAGFLRGRPSAADLIVYYVGHGGFLDDQSYFLALRETATDLEHASALRFVDLATTLKKAFRKRRIFVILDCCFAGSALPLLQGPAQDLIAQQTHGIALLSASARDKAAIVPRGGPRTMFSDCLCDVLSAGIAGGQERVSLRQVREAVVARIGEKYPDGARAWPEVHTPRQDGVDIADYPLFPNVARRLERERLAAQRDERERTAAAKAEQERARVEKTARLQLALEAGTQEPRATDWAACQGTAMRPGGEAAPAGATLPLQRPMMAALAPPPAEGTKPVATLPWQPPAMLARTPPLAEGTTSGATPRRRSSFARTAGVLCIGGGAVVLTLSVPFLATQANQVRKRYLLSNEMSDGKSNVTALAHGITSCANEPAILGPGEKTPRSRGLPPTSRWVTETLSTLGGKKYESASSDWNDEAFRCARFQLVGQQQFQYQWERQSLTTGVARARADFDGDGAPDINLSMSVRCEHGRDCIWDALMTSP
jgi:hypothetical protein